jgi:hypothetical protein
MKSNPVACPIELKNKPDFSAAMNRIAAWFQQEIIDRPPVRFTAHNAQYNEAPELMGKSWLSLKDRWFDAEYQVDLYLHSIQEMKFQAETFPVFFPNLGPEVYSAFYGSELSFQEVTSYSTPLVDNWKVVDDLALYLQNVYFRKIEELTEIALGKCDGQFLVGYTDLHPGVDCAAAWRDPQQFCLDLMLDPEQARKLINVASRDFQQVYDYFDQKLKSHGQLSVTWMGIPSWGKLHIPSCDFSALISSHHFEEFCLPTIVNEVMRMTQNIFHLDGKGVAKHLDMILSIPEINAIQWVQGMGPDAPILQWLPLIKKIQAAGKSVVVDLQVEELEEFIARMEPHGLLLCIPADTSIQMEIIRRIEKW